MRGHTKYEPKPLVADPLWSIDQGPPGESGRDSTVPGPVGATGPMGPPGESAKSFNPRGEYRSGRTYEPLDVVTDDGSSYLCVAETKSSPPGKAWQLLAAKGDPGDTPETIQGQRGRPGKDAVSGSVAKAFFDSAVVRGSVVRVSAANHVDLALAHSSDSSSLAIGLANATYGPGQFGELTTSGPFTNEAWNFAAGDCLYVSPTEPGGVTNVFPNTIGDRVVILGIMLTPNTVSLNIHYSVVIGT